MVITERFGISEFSCTFFNICGSLWQGCQLDFPNPGSHREAPNRMRQDRTYIDILNVPGPISPGTSWSLFLGAGTIGTGN